MSANIEIFDVQFFALSLHPLHYLLTYSMEQSPS